MSKREQLIKWMQEKKIFATHEIIEWGLQHYYLRADRTKRDLMKIGRIKKLTESEKERLGFNFKDAVYS